MIDLTPLDVRNKRGDFKKGMRGYDPQEVDVFLEIVAERLEALVRENMHLRDRTLTLQEQVNAQTGREQAVQDALVTAQELRKDIREQSQREADHAMREAESEARRMIAEADAEVRSRLRGVERQVDHARDALRELERRRNRFIQDFRGLLQRELDVVEVEEQRAPLETRTIEMALGGSARSHRGGDSDDQGREPASYGEVEPTGATADVAADGGSNTPDVRSSVEDAGADAGDRADPSDSVDAPDASETGVSRDGNITAREARSSKAAEADAGGARPSTLVDVADLGPGTAGSSAPGTPAAGTPSSLELELVAGAEGSVTEGPLADRFPEVPDLETVLAEAGIDEAPPREPQEISPPPQRRPEDLLALFDKDEDAKKR